MIKLDLKENRYLTDRDVAFILLANTCGKVLANRELYPRDIFMIAYRYLNAGCKCRGEYVSLVNYLIDDPDFRKELLKWIKLS